MGNTQNEIVTAVAKFLRQHEGHDVEGEQLEDQPYAFSLCCITCEEVEEEAMRAKRRALGLD